MKFKPVRRIVTPRKKSIYNKIEENTTAYQQYILCRSKTVVGV